MLSKIQTLPGLDTTWGKLHRRSFTELLIHYFSLVADAGNRGETQRCQECATALQDKGQKALYCRQVLPNMRAQPADPSGSDLCPLASLTSVSATLSFAEFFYVLTP